MKQSLTVKLFFNTLENKLWSTIKNLNSVQFSMTQKLEWTGLSQDKPGRLICDLEELEFEIQCDDELGPSLLKATSLKDLFQRCWGITIFTCGCTPGMGPKLLPYHDLISYTHGHIMSLTGMKNCIMDELMSRWYTLQPVHLRKDTPSISGLETFLKLKQNEKVEEIFIVEHLLLQRAGNVWLLGENSNTGVEWVEGGKELVGLLGDKLLLWFLQEFVYEELGAIVDRFLNWDTGRLNKMYDRDYFSMNWQNY